MLSQKTIRLTPLLRSTNTNTMHIGSPLRMHLGMQMDNTSLDGLDNEIRSSLETIGQQVEIERFANKGANGYVFFGRNKILNRKVAIKYYYWGSDPRLHDEPRLLSQIESPYVIPVLNAGPVGSNWAMFQTPYCEYGDLDGMIEATTLSTHAAIDRITEVLTGLSVLHTSDLVHRDTKPGNILIGDTGCAMIGDFGSVKAVSEEGRVNSASGQSALYRPPESFSHSEYTKVSDIYQCGLVFFQLLGGHLPSKERELLDTAGRWPKTGLNVVCAWTRPLDV